METNHKITVLGSGCPGCKKLHGLAVEAARDLGLGGEVEYVTDVERIIELGIMQSPALTVDGEVVLAGYIPDADQVREAIAEAMGGAGGSGAETKKGGCGCEGSGCC